MTKQIMVLATQNHIDNGNLPQSYTVQVFDSIIQGKELYLDSKLFKGLDLNNEVVKELNSNTSDNNNLKKIIKLVQSKCVSSKGTMLVNFDNVNSEYDIFQNILDEIASLEIILDSSDIEEEQHFDMTVREAKGLLKKMKTFVKNYAHKFLNEEEMKDVKIN